MDRPKIKKSNDLEIFKNFYKNILKRPHKFEENGLHLPNAMPIIAKELDFHVVYLKWFQINQKT